MMTMTDDWSLLGICDVVTGLCDYDPGCHGEDCGSDIFDDYDDVNHLDYVNDSDSAASWHGEGTPPIWGVWYSLSVPPILKVFPGNFLGKLENKWFSREISREIVIFLRKMVKWAVRPKNFNIFEGIFTVFIWKYIKNTSRINFFWNFFSMKIFSESRVLFAVEWILFAMTLIPEPVNPPSEGHFGG